MKRTKKLAFSGVMTALAVVFLLIGSLIQTLDLGSAALGSLVVLVAFIELGRGYAYGVWVSASVIAVLTLPNKAPAVIFALFAGYYPVLKELLNSIKPRLVSYIARIAVFNVFFSAILYASVHLLGLTDGFYRFDVLIYALGNVTFLLYDFALERLAVFYTLKLKGRFIKSR